MRLGRSWPTEILDHEVWRLRWAKDTARTGFQKGGEGKIKRMRKKIGTVESILATLARENPSNEELRAELDPTIPSLMSDVNFGSNWSIGGCNESA